VAASWEVGEPDELASAREHFAQSAWQDRESNRMKALEAALVAGEEAARVSADGILSSRNVGAHPGPLISGTLFGERQGKWSIGVGPDWNPEEEPPDFIRPAAEAERVAMLCSATTLPSFWRWIEPKRDRPRWDVLEGLLEFCEQHGLAAKSFALYWGGIGGCPVWLRGLPHKEKLQAIERWTTQIVQRYRGRIASWETVNEMHDWHFANPFGWSHAQTLEVTRLVSELVGALDPGKPRIVNHCSIWGEYAQNRPGIWTPLTYLDALLEAGIPFEGIGLQYYNPGRDLLECLLHLDEFARFGKEIWVTEMGTPSDPRGHGQVETGQIDPLVGWRGTWSPERQADWVELWYTLASSRPVVKALNWWDVTDSQAFIAHAGLLDDQGRPKPSYERLQAWCRRHRLGREANR
jgi:GH35 family endo-1,4-beta-xylanase